MNLLSSWPGGAGSGSLQQLVFCSLWAEGQGHAEFCFWRTWQGARRNLVAAPCVVEETSCPRRQDLNMHQHNCFIPVSRVYFDILTIVDFNVNVVQRFSAPESTHLEVTAGNWLWGNLHSSGQLMQWYVVHLLSLGHKSTLVLQEHQLRLLSNQYIVDVCTLCLAMPPPFRLPSALVKSDFGFDVIFLALSKINFSRASDCLAISLSWSLASTKFCLFLAMIFMRASPSLLASGTALGPTWRARPTFLVVRPPVVLRKVLNLPLAPL